MPDNINPAHYQGFSNGAQVIDITENLTLNRGTAVKYLARAGVKSPDTLIEDLEKAKWYVEREIQRVKNIAANVEDDDGVVDAEGEQIDEPVEQLKLKVDPGQLYIDTLADITRNRLNRTSYDFYQAHPGYGAHNHGGLL